MKFEKLKPDAQKIAVEASAVLNHLSIAATMGNPSPEAVQIAVRALHDYIEAYWNVPITEANTAAGMAIDTELQEMHRGG